MDARVVRGGTAAGSVEKSIRNTANQDQNKASYKAAITRCDAMAGAGKDTRMTDAKRNKARNT